VGIACLCGINDIMQVLDGQCSL
ncbi:hypothetical protein A2U01_0110133, partial [Trifolium medium]|nr:hypothetical protein [Trifolium medium]